MSDSHEDRLARFQAASDTFDDRVHQVPEDRWSAPTPCTDWDVRTLVKDAITTAGAYLSGKTPDSTNTYDNGKIKVPAKPSVVKPAASAPSWPSGVRGSY